MLKKLQSSNNFYMMKYQKDQQSNRIAQKKIFEKPRLTVVKLNGCMCQKEDS